MEIISYHPDYATHFKALNVAWLTKYFYLEPHDNEVLGDPEKYIIAPGGTIFFIKDETKILGTVALMKIEEGVFELTKMAVAPEAQGKKIGQKLMAHALDFGHQKNWESLVLYSSRKLKNAIHIYRKFGFKEIPLEENNPYARGDIKMRLLLS